MYEINLSGLPDLVVKSVDNALRKVAAWGREDWVRVCASNSRDWSDSWRDVWHALEDSDRLDVAFDLCDAVVSMAKVAPGSESWVCEYKCDPYCDGVCGIWISGAKAVVLSALVVDIVGTDVVDNFAAHGLN